MYKADLHCHSSYSDGTMHPIELLKFAKKKGLAAISITDHDTINGYTEEVYRKAKELQVRLFPGIEISSRLENHSIHILGYAYKRSQSFLAFCLQHQKRRLDRNRAILKNLRNEGVFIEEKDFIKFGSKTNIGRPHIAKIMMEKGIISNIQEAFNLYIGEGKKCFVAGDFLSPKEIIDELHKASGKAFIAHPHLIKKPQILQKIFEMHFDGIECYYGLSHYAQEKRWLKIAKKKGWLVSGGSDFHGSLKSHNELGCSWVNEENTIKIFGNL